MDEFENHISRFHSMFKPFNTKIFPLFQGFQFRPNIKNIQTRTYHKRYYCTSNNDIILKHTNFNTSLNVLIIHRISSNRYSTYKQSSLINFKAFMIT